MTTLQTIHAELRALTERVRAIEARQNRFMRQWIATHLTSATYTQIGQTPPISTVTSVASPTTANASTRPSRGSLFHAKEHIPRVLGWLAEKILPYVWAYLLPLLVAAWGLVYGYGAKLWQYLLGLSHWLRL